MQRQGIPAEAPQADEAVSARPSLPHMEQTPHGEGCLRAEGKDGKHCFILPGSPEPKDGSVTRCSRRPQPHTAARPLYYGNSQGELLTQAPSVLLLGFHGVEVGQLDDIGPHRWTGAPTEPAEKQKSRV